MLCLGDLGACPQKFCYCEIVSVSNFLKMHFSSNVEQFELLTIFEVRIIGASLSEPHIDGKYGAARAMYVYVCQCCECN